jgi:hypothetical protein
MVGIHSLAIFLFESFIGSLCGESVEGKLDASGIISISTIDALDGRVRGEGVSSTILVLLIDAHHLEGQTTYVHVLSNEA